jgi:hypothetical protein
MSDVEDPVKDTIEVARRMYAPCDEVVSLFWDIEAWHAVWDRINTVYLVYDDALHQEFSMSVERDGRIEQVRTIRFRTSTGDIEFFSPDPPPTMVSHRGSWLFRTGPGCLVTARREYRLHRYQSESIEELTRRRRKYAQNFSSRLERILECFADYFSSLSSLPRETRLP